MTEPLSTGYSPVIYNALLGVGKANDELRAEGRFDAFMKPCSALFYRHQMQGHFGVGLLHNHNYLDESEFMIEAEEYMTPTRHALVTSATDESPQQRNAFPILWQCLNDKFIPLEFSTDPVAVGLLNQSAVPNAFLAEFRQLVREFDAESLIGLAIVSRQFYESAKANEMPVEFTDEPGRRNVVLLCDRVQVAGKTIETAWEFVGETGGLVCASNCRKQCYWQGDKHVDIHQQHHTPVPG